MSIDHLLGKVHNVDCLEFMKQLPDKCVDLVLTDPPYGLPNEDIENVKSAMLECRRISKSQIYILDWRYPLSLSDGKYAELVWEYGWISGGRSKSNHFYPTHNTIHFCGEQSFRFDTKDGSIITRRPGFSSPRQCSFAVKSGHPFEKPRALMQYLILRATYIGQIILDPFSGSGTTLVCSNNLNRKWFGCELESKYVQIANKRIEAERAQLKMF